MKKSFILIPIALFTLVMTSCGTRGGSSSSSRPTTTETTGGGTTGGTTSGTSESSTTGSTKTSSTSSSKPSSSSTSNTLGPAPSKTELAYDYNDYIDYNTDPISNCPTKGTPKVLIIPIWFTDSTNYIATANKETVRSDIEKAYLGTSEETGWRSVKSYYSDLSNGQLTLTGVVADWYSCGRNMSYYASDDNSVSKTRALVETATNNYFTTSGDSRTDFDSDGDGYLDAVLLIYGAPDYDTLDDESKSNLWAYCFWLMDTSKKSVSDPGPNVFFWASYDFMYSSSKASTQTGQSSYGRGDTRYCNIDAHTYIHEMGHVLGLEDYYDYSNICNPAGSFSMQDYNVGSHDPFSAMAYGYVDPYIPTQSCQIELKPFQSNKEVILLSNHSASVNSPFDEYLLLELYTPTGLNEFDVLHQYNDRYPQGPNTAGIRVWHVDARLTKITGSTPSTTLYTNPKIGNVYLAMSNTYYSAKYIGYCSPLGEGYYDYNVLQLIRKDTSQTYRPTGSLAASDLFTAGSSFSMNTYKNQFVNSARLNSNGLLGWTFKVDTCTSSGATITVTKS